ncbi:MFS transporter [Glutamicibacter sp. NPDC087673]|uniref:MFS transporter n=1 Tax=Glutamicibacter sp. NPDC087673 TaxID=3363997 RepID=UPI003818DC12
MTTTSPISYQPFQARARLPWGALLALSSAGFLAIFTETMPAGLLPQLASGLGTSPAGAGQLVTLYAVGSLLAAIPLIFATRRMDRKKVLLCAVLGLVLFNTVTALAPWYPLVLLARFAAGAAAALIWGVMSGYARSLVIESLQGRALTIAGLGQPIALALGVPLGAWAGSIVDWRWVFLGISVAALALFFWILVSLPPIAGRPETRKPSLGSVLRIRGVRMVLFVALFWVLAHNVLYTYIAPVLSPSGLNLDLGLLLFGVASFAGITITGLVIDRAMRVLILGCLSVMGIAGLVLAHPELGSLAAATAIILWGIGFGGAPVLLQTCLADRAGKNTDVAQSLFVTVFNLAVAGGGLAGGAVLALGGSSETQAWTVLVLMVITAATVVVAKRTFAPGRRTE